jgi:hypothetical protein
VLHASFDSNTDVAVGAVVVGVLTIVNAEWNAGNAEEHKEKYDKEKPNESSIFVLDTCDNLGMA